MARWLAMMFILWLGLATQALAEPVVITLTQTACQFIEPEAKNYAFKSASFDECVVINADTQDQRLDKVKPLQLKPGSYLFRVYNRDVAYDLGFWLRGKGLARLTHNSVSGGGIHTGGFRDYAIDLEAGEYWYSCPLNPTINYSLEVK
ncbi:MAG: hypothetical protein R8K49_07460 [Mariprofundaceae bacterium]